MIYSVVDINIQLFLSGLCKWVGLCGVCVGGV